MLGVSFDEDITTMQTAEKSDDCVEAAIGFLIIQALKTLLQLIIAI
jgi:hypothetical protein